MITDFLIYMYILQLIVGFGYSLNQYDKHSTLYLYIDYSKTTRRSSHLRQEYKLQQLVKNLTEHCQDQWL